VLNVGDMFGHIPLPAKMTIEVLPAIEVREMDLGEAYDVVIERMQTSLTALQHERRLPVIG
jgi:hypothetical protein